MRHYALIALVLSLALSVLPAQAERRVALVIGNSAYEHASTLRNPKNDADDMATALGRVGFEVVQGTDLDYRGMRDLLRDFSEKSAGAEVALFFYAGHALQVDGDNFLIPTDTALESEADLDFEAISLGLVQKQMQRSARTLLVFLDACRDNPFAGALGQASRSAGGTRGLARVENSPRGELIVFATQPGNVALDGTGRNSPFTEALLANIERPDIEISTLMTSVRQQVYASTSERQLPWTSSSLLGHFYFRQSVPSAAGETLPPQVASLPPANTVPDVPAPEAPPVDVAAVQAELNRVGCEVGSVDGIWGKKSRTAVESFARQAGITLASVEPSADLLELLQSKDGRVCPLVCGVRYDKIGETCVLKTCPSGQKLSSKGVCYVPKAATTTAAAKPASTSASSAVSTPTTSAAPAASAGNCFEFNGETICD